MAEQVYSSEIMQAVSPSATQVPTRGNRQLGISSRATSFSDDNERSEWHDWIYSLVVDIVKHPNFDAFFPHIEQCLLMDDPAWTLYSRFRDDPEAKSKLLPFHSSIWHAPPDDLWSRLVQLRQYSGFSSLQSLILVEIQNACRPVHRRVRNPNSLSVPAPGPGRAIGYFSTLGSSSYQRPTSSTAAVYDRNDHVSTMDSSHGNSPMAMVPTLSATTNPSWQPLRTRIAPGGMVFQCPSLNCQSQFVKIAFYKKHLERQHPDFALQHPHHVPEMSIRPRASSSTSNDLATPNSVPSHQFYGEANNDGYMTTSNMSGLDLSMFNDSEFSYMGGATSTNGA